MEEQPLPNLKEQSEAQLSAPGQTSRLVVPGSQSTLYPVTFEVQGFKTPELSNLAIPLAVRRTDLTLVKRVLGGETVELPAGNYYVSTHLPAGQELTSLFEVPLPPEAAQTVALQPDPADESPHEGYELNHFLGLPAALRTPVVRAVDGDSLPDAGNRALAMAAQDDPLSAGLEESFDSAPASNPVAQVRLRFWIGNIFDDSLELIQEINKSTDLSIEVHPSAPDQPQIVQISIRSYTRQQLITLQVLQSGLPAINVALPVSKSSCQVVISRSPEAIGNQPCALDIHMSNVEADLLLRYRTTGSLKAAAETLNSPRVWAEDLLRGKSTDPLAAVVGAYTLLRLNDLDRLHDWTANLKNWFSWLPDGITIYGEHLAREGRHQDALTTFLELPQRGLPIFSDGASFILDRLRLYILQDEQEREKGHAPTFNDVHIEAAKKLLSRLQNCAAYMDFGKAYSTCCGLQPSEPEDSPLPYDLHEYGGLNLTSELTP